MCTSQTILLMPVSLSDNFFSHHKCWKCQIRNSSTQLGWPGSPPAPRARTTIISSKCFVTADWQFSEIFELTISLKDAQIIHQCSNHPMTISNTFCWNLPVIYSLCSFIFPDLVLAQLQVLPHRHHVRVHRCPLRRLPAGRRTLLWREIQIRRRHVLHRHRFPPRPCERCHRVLQGTVFCEIQNNKKQVQAYPRY